MIIIHTVNKDEFEKEIKTGSYGTKVLKDVVLFIALI